MNVLTVKRNVILLSLAASIIALISSGRDWVTGSLNDGVTQAMEVTATGNQTVPGFFGMALVSLAGIIAAATSGRIVRWIAVVLSLLGSLAMVGSCIWALNDPEHALKGKMAEVTGHTGEALIRATLTPWFWAAVFASILALTTSVLALLGVRRWPGLSSRYDAPADAKKAHRSDWDLMTDGIDPTDHAADTPSGTPSDTRPDAHRPGE